MIEFFGIPYAEYIGGSIGTLILVIIVWFLIKSSRSGREGIEIEEIKEDRQLFDLDKKILKTEKDEKYETKQIYKLLLKVHKRGKDSVS